jgi:hypothetical protein
VSWQSVATNRSVRRRRIAPRCCTLLVAPARVAAAVKERRQSTPPTEKVARNQPHHWRGRGLATPTHGHDAQQRPNTDTTLGCEVIQQTHGAAQRGFPEYMCTHSSAARLLASARGVAGGDSLMAASMLIRGGGTIMSFLSWLLLLPFPLPLPPSATSGMGQVAKQRGARSEGRCKRCASEERGAMQEGAWARGEGRGARRGVS